MPPLPADLVEALSDRYRLERELGRGGMATVYLATDGKHGRQVAIKVMLPEMAALIGRDRFLREIEIAARLTHPHILPLHDSGAAAGHLYYVTPYIGGDTLRTRLNQEPQLPVDEAVRLAKEVAAALAHAHQQGIVHRDIKPENILLADGMAVVADFGIARMMTRSTADAATLPGGATLPGMIVGTPRYMAPEQATGQELDGRADIYALGCVLYEMLAGEPPFTAPNPEGLIHQHQTLLPRSIRDLRPAVPAATAGAIDRALAKLPADRPATAARFAEALTSTTADTPPPPATTGDHTNLPRPRTPFIGREREVAECRRLLEETVLLTLTGIGGSGKTRLGLRVAETLLPSFPEGVWFVDLAPLKDAEHVAQALATAMGVKESGDASLLESLVTRVSGKQMLILLDNCEHVLGACAELADRLLTSNPELRMLVTSREGLGIPGERLYALHSLAVPPASLTDRAAIEATDSVRLFLDRARAVDPDFKLTDASAPVVGEICRRLDGIPLAIELAAARVKILSPEQIRSRLDDRFRLLTGGSKTALPRHQTLRATIQWSYDQLSPEEQRLFRALSVFAGGWNLEAAVRVVGAQGDEFEVMDHLAHLVDKSLILVERSSDREPRYGLLETVRQFAQDRLVDTGEAEAARQGHLETFRDLAETAYQERESHEDSWAAALEAEHDNLRAALEFAKNHGPEPYLDLAGTLAWFWALHSHFHEGRGHLEAALMAASAEPARPARARALRGAGGLISTQGDANTALRLLDDALAMWRGLKDAEEVAATLKAIGWAQFLAGNSPAARTTFRELLDLRLSQGNEVLINRERVALAQVLVDLGDLAEVRELSRRMIEFARPRGDRRTVHFGLHYLADCALLEGQPEEALGHYRESLELVRDLGDRAETCFEVEGVAMSLAGLGYGAAALRLAGAAQAEWDRMGVNFRVEFWNRLKTRYLGAAREALGPAASEAAWNDGLRLAFHQAVAEGLRGRPDREPTSLA